MNKKSIIAFFSAFLVIGALGAVVALGLHMGGVVKLPFINETPMETMSEAYGDMNTSSEVTDQSAPAVTQEEVISTIAVTVPTVPVLREIQFSQEKVLLNLGDTYSLEPIYLPEDAVVSDYIQWISEDEDIITVDQGLLTAVGGGKTRVTVILDGCTASIEVEVQIPLEGISFAEEKIEIGFDDKSGQRVVLTPENTTERPAFLWTSSNEEVVTVDEDGNLTPLSIGEATISASYGDFVTSYQVRVVVPITTASLSEEALTLARGSKKQIILGYAPVETTDDTTITWSSSDPNVVSVSGGVLTAHNVGYAIIYATIASFELSCEVNVVAPIVGVAINYPSLDLKMGMQVGLAVTINPVDTTDDTTVIWASSNPAVVSVDNNGVVTATGIGEAEVVAKIGEHLVSSKIKVSIPLESIAFDRYVINLEKGQTDRLTVGFYPENTTSAKKVSWAVSDPKVITVSKDGLITAVGGGSAVVGATVDGITLNCVVNVSAPLIGIAISGGDFSLEQGRQSQLKLIYNPTDTTVDRTALWASADPAIATVDANGLVTGVSVGTTQIVANVGGLLTACNVTVTKRVDGPKVTLVFDPGHGGVFVGSAATHYGITYYERDQNLKVALYCKSYLEAHYEGVTIYMTRTTNTQLSTNVDTDLRMRCALGAQVGANAVVSFHFNGVASHTAYGATVLCTSDPRYREVSDGLASSVLAQLSALGIHNRGLVHKLNTGGEDYFAINRYSTLNGLPSILIEHCFMDNIAEYQYFGTEEALQTLGAADAIGIANYYGLKAK